MLTLLVAAVAVLLSPGHCRDPEPTPSVTSIATLNVSNPASVGDEGTDWQCPDMGVESGKAAPAVTCSCDLPHTLRCTGGPATLQVVAAALQSLPPRYVSLLDATVAGVALLRAPLLAGVSLHGLVVSGELRAVEADAFSLLAQDDGEPRLQALGLPGNLLDAVPAAALRALPGLDRLDLSHNRLRTLPADTFQGLHNLTFLDLSDNQLTELSSAAFAPLGALRVLRLTGNRLRTATIAPLEGLRLLEELDLSSNQLAGPLGPGALPRLPNLRSLNLAHNQLSSVRRGALAGLPALSALALPHNMVDVLEDHAFRQLGSLTSLDLAHNRIVAVSGASLAHLGRLRVLSLQHNFLRVLTADLVRPLAALQTRRITPRDVRAMLKDLHLDDNDISAVAEDALEAAGRLSRLTLSENPLNCDCALAPFAWWLRNATHLPSADRASAVCAAPPHLENGLLEDVAVAELLCQESPGADQDAGPGGRPQPLSDTRVTLRAFQFNGSRMSLLWAVNVTAAPYVCDALFVYEEAGAHELLLESTPLGCDSSQLADPRSLLLSLPAAHLSPGRRYRFCLVLMEGGGAHDDLALVVGCSDVLPLVKTTPGSGAPRHTTPLSPRISGLSANLTGSGALAVWVQMLSAPAPSPSCRLTVTVFTAGALVAQERLNCSLPWTVLGSPGLGPGPLQVCATVGDSAATMGRTRCTSVAGVGRAGTEPLPAVTAGLAAALAGLVTGSAAALLFTLWLTARWRRREEAGGGGPRVGSAPQEGSQLYRPPPPNENDEQHSRYVKLQATTMV